MHSFALIVDPFMVQAEVRLTCPVIKFNLDTTNILGVYCLIAASFSTCIMNWKEDVAIFMTRYTLLNHKL